ncbi:hypothetical protein [Anaerocolumna chitinilytica]|uniref:Uncharacterized protein n=1 Tax=Anaerocolumna chitinilytica TaxID=1727145 RepID=A0A7M3SA17_9FIRM|nr:hypothetical protein [Anaerocolumna chitinilytica]BCK01435.1 hypothetical protein bsdcttw_44750 [Anaerocolumna chitinilytica]
MSKVTIYDTIEKKNILENVTQVAASLHLGVSNDCLSRAKRRKRLVKRRYRILDLACEKGDKEYLKTAYALEFEFRNLCLWVRNHSNEEQLKKIKIVPKIEEQEANYV